MSKDDGELDEKEDRQEAEEKGSGLLDLRRVLAARWGTGEGVATFGSPTVSPV